MVTLGTRTQIPLLSGGLLQSVLKAGSPRREQVGWSRERQRGQRGTGEGRRALVC